MARKADISHTLRCLHYISCGATISGNTVANKYYTAESWEAKVQVKSLKKGGKCAITADTVIHAGRSVGVLSQSA